VRGGSLGWLCFDRDRLAVTADNPSLAPRGPPCTTQSWPLSPVSLVNKEASVESYMRSLYRSVSPQANKDPDYNREILSSKAVVDLPGTKGMMTIFPPADSTARRSAGFNESKL